MHEDAAKVVGVLLHSVVQGLDLLLIQKAQNVLLEGTRALARNDLDQWCLLQDRLVDDGAQCTVDVSAVVVDVMQVELELHAVIGFRPHAETIGEVVRSRRPDITLARCRSTSASEAMPAATIRSRTCLIVARSSSMHAGPPSGK